MDWEFVLENGEIMDKNYIFVCKSLTKDKAIYYDVISKKIIQTSFNTFDSKWAFLSLVFYPLYKVLSNSELYVSPLLLVLSSLALGLLLGFIVARIQFNHETPRKKIDIEITDIKDIKLFLERGEKFLQPQFAFYLVILLFTIINSIDLYTNRSIGSLLLSLVFGSLIVIIWTQFDFYRRKKLYAYLSKEVKKG